MTSQYICHTRSTPPRKVREQHAIDRAEDVLISIEEPVLLGGGGGGGGGGGA